MLEKDLVSNQRSSDAVTMAQIKLRDIPQLLFNANITYELRGVICFRHGKSQLRHSSGHYMAYMKRGEKNWELYDDLKKKPIPIKDIVKVSIEFLFYTI